MNATVLASEGRQRLNPGRRTGGPPAWDPRGRRIGCRPWQPEQPDAPLDTHGTINAALIRQTLTDSPAALTREDLHVQVRSQKSRRLVVFVIDTSDSMGGGPTTRISAAFGAIVAIARRAYLQREQVCLITFRDRQARVVVPPTNSVMRIRQQLHRLPVGGATPLASGLAKARQVIGQARLKNPLVEPLVVLISDGEATTPLQPGGNPNQEAIDIAVDLHRNRIPALVIDTVSGRRKPGIMPRIAEAFATPCRHLHNLQADQVLELIDQTQRENRHESP